MSEKLATIHDAVFNGAGVRFVDIGNAHEVTCQAVRLGIPADKNRVDCPFEQGG